MHLWQCVPCIQLYHQRLPVCTALLNNALQHSLGIVPLEVKSRVDMLPVYAVLLVPCLLQPDGGHLHLRLRQDPGRCQQLGEPNNLLNTCTHGTHASSAAWGAAAAAAAAVERYARTMHLAHPCSAICLSLVKLCKPPLLRACHPYRLKDATCPTAS